MKRFCSKARFCAIAVVALAVLCLCGGCDDPADLLSQANGYTAQVAYNMAARGWDGFPSNPITLADYIRDLAASVADAKRGPVTTAVPRGVRRVTPEAWNPEPLGEAFGLPGGER